MDNNRILSLVGLGFSTLGLLLILFASYLRPQPVPTPACASVDQVLVKKLYVVREKEQR